MIYLDNSATTPLSASAKEKIKEVLDIFGNPSSLHSEGLRAEKEITEARGIIAKSLSAREDEVYFTSSGTESDNTAIFGGARKNAKVGRKIITTDSEHPAVSKPIEALEKEGFEVVRLSTRGGKIDLDEVEKNADGTALVSVMRTNNETGAVYDVKAISEIVKSHSPRAIVHSDCVQAYMKERLSLSSLGADIISVSGHKVHALKGVGALVIKKGLVLPPLILGGGQERGMRSSTENTVGIASFGASVGELMREGNGLSELYLYAKERLSRFKLNIPEKACDAIISVTLEGYRSEIILHALSREGIFVSSGSACSSHSGKSGVLEAFGLTPKEADGTIRVSLSRYNTKEDIDALFEALEKITKNTKRVK